MTLNLVLLVLYLIVLAVWVLADGAEYRKFKAFTTTEERQRAYRRWIAVSFVLFGLGSLATLALLGRVSAVAHFPAELAPSHDVLRRFAGDGHDFLTGAGIAAAGAVVGATLLQLVLAKRQVMLGDIDALLPRNACERWLGAALSLNAGFSEELFFRLTLPLLLVNVIGDLPLACGAAIVIFGLVHAYQGWIGVLATTIIGALFMALYVWTGNIWIPMIVHAALDMRTLVLQSWISEKIGARAKA